MLIALLATGIFILEYIGILSEHLHKRHKAIIALGAGFFLMALAAISNPPHFIEERNHSTLEVVAVFFFLFFAMAHIANIEGQGFFDWVRVRIYKLGLGDRGQFLVIQVFTFFGSAIFDNLTTALISIAIAKRFFKGQNLAITTIAIIYNANSGGAWSFLGDIPTIMFWLSGRFTPIEVAQEAFVQCVVMSVILTIYLITQLSPESNNDSTIDLDVDFNWKNALLTLLSIGSFFLTVAARNVGAGLDPFMGLGFGLFIVWLVRDLIYTDRNDSLISSQETHFTELGREIKRDLMEIDWATLVFFVGILYSVSALSILGVLEHATAAMQAGWNLIPGISVESGTTWIYLNNYVLGLLSAFVDNIPLAALADNSLPYTDPQHWSNLAFTLGNGGSLIVIGSAAGIVALGKVPEIQKYYLKVSLKVGLPAFTIASIIGAIL